MTVTATRELTLQSFVATQEQHETVRLAVAAYGYLVRTQPPRSYTFGEFADVISQHYDVSHARNRAVVDTLRQVQADSNPTLH